MTKILVLGSTGTVGAGLVEGLVARGADVRAATRSPDGYAGPRGATPVAFDATNPETYGEALDGVDRVFLLSPPGHADAHALLAPVVEASVAAGVKRIVTMTAMGVDASDEIPLRRLELAVEATGVPFAHLRPNWFDQNFHTFWYEPIAKAGVIPLPAADAKTSFIDARDISASAVAALLDEGVTQKAYTLTGPAALTYAEAAAILSNVGGRTIQYVDTDEGTFAENLSGAGLPSDYAQLLVGLFQVVRAGAAAPVTGDVERLTKSKPRSVRQYAQDHAEKFRTQL